jgi:hypothetical protein
MPIERQTHPYEITLRFKVGAEHECQGALGDFCGAHYIEGTATVDTDTGEVIAYKAGIAQDLPKDKIEEYIGMQAGNMANGYRAMEAERDEARAELQRVIADTKEAREIAAAEMKQVFDAAAAQIRALEAKVAAFDQMRTQIATALSLAV